MDKLYALYHQSSKNQNELRQVTMHLDAQLLKIVRILSFRWVASTANCAALCDSVNTSTEHQMICREMEKKKNKVATSV